MKTIVIGTDGSEPASAAVATALGLAADTGAGVVCVGIDDSFSKKGIDPAPTAAAESAARRARERGPVLVVTAPADLAAVSVEATSSTVAADG